MYQARDTKLDRADPDLKQRFEREAKTISSLNHAHICAVHDIGTQQPSTHPVSACPSRVLASPSGTDTLWKGESRGRVKAA